MSLFLGIDLGSSSIKFSVLNGDTGSQVGFNTYPKTEMEIKSSRPGWAEQDPDKWWEYTVEGLKELADTVDLKNIAAIGITYQMHGLVAVDRNLNPVIDAIIWCDSRAVALGNKASSDLDDDLLTNHLLNSPGNFTASKLKWVKENKPEAYQKIYKIMLPGDFIALRLTGQVQTTAAGLSEGILWDFKRKQVSSDLLDYYQFDKNLIPVVVENLTEQSRVSDQAAEHLGLTAGTPVTYRAGDQPNNAFSLNVLHAGEVAATAGTSGVVYAVTDQNVYDHHNRVNTFLHVNDQQNATRNGVLLCINGAGISYSWLKRLLQVNERNISYAQLNELAATAPVGSKGLAVYPFGNGAERMLGNIEPGGKVENLNFNIHTPEYFARAFLEGVVFSLNYGLQALKELGNSVSRIRAGYANLFFSPVFREIFVNTTGVPLDLYETNGAEGAARGAALGAGFYNTEEEAFENLRLIETVNPAPDLVEAYAKAYNGWKDKM